MNLREPATERHELPCILGLQTGRQRDCPCRLVQSPSLQSRCWKKEVANPSILTVKAALASTIEPVVMEAAVTLGTLVAENVNWTKSWIEDCRVPSRVSPELFTAVLELALNGECHAANKI